jgi:hypothetical protein
MLVYEVWPLQWDRLEIMVMERFSTCLALIRAHRWSGEVVREPTRNVQLIGLVAALQKTFEATDETCTRDALKYTLVIVTRGPDRTVEYAVYVMMLKI